MSTVRLILGDQLNPLHSWFQKKDKNVTYVMFELRQETDYVLHHAQKIIAIFAAMRDFSDMLRQAGHQVHYVPIDEPTSLQSLPENLDQILAHYHATAFEYLEPDEWRLDDQLSHYAKSLDISTQMHTSEHFMCPRDEVARFFSGKQQWVMERFYRKVRVRHNVLLEVDQTPAGGQWNFDHDNRKAWSGTPAEPVDTRISHDHTGLWATILQAGVKSFGTPQAGALAWPLNRAEALDRLDDFIEQTLPDFGNFQDAMSTKSWRMFHALISFALNTKMLHPQDAIKKAEQAWRNGTAPLSAVEGFIRQILGWREYVRGVYWAHMPGYTEKNMLQQKRSLPAWFWTGQTRMRCLSHSIGQSLEHAYAHHIQRLMVIGNFALLAEVDPTEVHRWYLGVYIDAFEWVEAPNTLGMSQFADGGLLATKPYVSSAAYIDRMSDYCKGCHYKKKERIGEQACPFNALYWDFFMRNSERLSKNPRLGIPYAQLAKMDATTVNEIQLQARSIRERMEDL